MKDDELYRPCVGAMIINEDNKVWLGKRINIAHPEAKLLWQMPQGGVDDGEDYLSAMKRELFEEVGIDYKNVKLIHSLDDWLKYEIPKKLKEKFGKNARMKTSKAIMVIIMKP